MEHVNAVCVWSGYNVAKSGTDSIKLRFKVGDNPPDIVRPGAILYADLWLSDKCIQKSRDVLRGVFGWFGQDIFDFVDSHDLLNGIEVDLAVDWEDYNGNRELKVKFVNPVGGAPDNLTSIDRETARKRADEIRAKLMYYDQNDQRKAAEQGGAPTPAKPKAKPTPKAADRSMPKPAPKSNLPPVEMYEDAPPEPEDDFPF